METTVLFAPTYGSTEPTDYTDLALSVMAKKNLACQFVPLEWEQTINEWVAQYANEYLKRDPKNTILAGFGYGAVTAFITAAQKPPKRLLLFSLSARFAEDIPKLPKVHKDHMGAERQQAFAMHRFARYAPRITCPTDIFVGERESIWTQHRTREADRQVPQSRLTVVPRTGHDLTNVNYLEAIWQCL